MAVAAAGRPPAAGAAEEAVEEQDEFDVVLEAAGDKKIQVIKEVRALTSLGLKEAKDLVDGAPKPVLEKVNKEAADKAASRSRAPAPPSPSSDVLTPTSHDGGDRDGDAPPPVGGPSPRLSTVREPCGC